jgi:hypothetical protein
VTVVLGSEYVQAYISFHGLGPYECEHCHETVEKLGGRKRGIGVIHHRDEDRSNNSIANLAVMHHECHTSHHRAGKTFFLPEQARVKIGDALRGKAKSQQHRKNLSKALMGNELSEDARQKISAASKGRLKSAETRKRMSEGQRLRFQDPEARKRLSASQQGKVIPAEQRARISRTLAGGVVVDWDEAARLYNSGMTGKEIAKYFGCSSALIYKWLPKRGVIMRSSGPRHKEVM